MAPDGASVLFVRLREEIEHLKLRRPQWCERHSTVELAPRAVPPEGGSRFTRSEHRLCGRTITKLRLEPDKLSGSILQRTVKRQVAPDHPGKRFEIARGIGRTGG